MKWKLGKITYEFVKDKCQCGVGRCAEACGQGVLDFSEMSNKMKVVNLSQCILCRQCEDVCPRKAISIKGALTIRNIRIGQ
jgi:NAD-dependent dihydropyrimidine dehydrogenase PreA subunit